MKLFLLQFETKQLVLYYVKAEVLEVKVSFPYLVKGRPGERKHLYA